MVRKDAVSVLPLLASSPVVATKKVQSEEASLDAAFAEIGKWPAAVPWLTCGARRSNPSTQAVLHGRVLFTGSLLRRSRSAQAQPKNLPRSCPCNASCSLFREGYPRHHPHAVILIVGSRELTRSRYLGTRVGGTLLLGRPRLGPAHGRLSPFAVAIIHAASARVRRSPGRELW